MGQAHRLAEMLQEYKPDRKEGGLDILKRVQSLTILVCGHRAAYHADGALRLAAWAGQRYAEGEQSTALGVFGTLGASRRPLGGQRRPDGRRCSGFARFGSAGGRRFFLLGRLVHVRAERPPRHAGSCALASVVRRRVRAAVGRVCGALHLDFERYDGGRERYGLVGLSGPHEFEAIADALHDASELLAAFPDATPTSSSATSTSPSRHCSCRILGRIG